MSASGYWYLARCQVCIDWHIRTESKATFDAACKEHRKTCKP